MISFTIASKMMQYLVINLTEDVYALRTENRKTLIKKKLEDSRHLNEWKGVLYVHGL